MSEQVSILDAHGRAMSEPFDRDTSNYGASFTASELSQWMPTIETPDSEIFGERGTLISRSADLERNDGLAHGAIQTIIDHVVGTGFKLAPKPNFRALGWTREFAREWSRDTASKFLTWARSRECDAARERTFASMTAAQFRTGLMQGEAMAIPFWIDDEPDRKWYTAVAPIDPIRCDTPPGQEGTPNLRYGVQKTKRGRPQGYHVMKQHPGDAIMDWSNSGAMEFEYIQAFFENGRRRFIHMHDVERNGMTRGKPILSSVLPDFRMRADYKRNEMKSAITNSLIAAFLESPLGPEQMMDMFGGQGKSQGQAVKDYIKDRNKYQTQLEGGAVIPLYPGDKLSSFNPGRPNQIFGEFMEAVARQIGVATGMPYELVMKDFSKASYAAVRSAMNEAWRFFMGRRAWLTDYWLQPCYELWLEEAIERDEIYGPGFYENRSAYSNAEWIGPGRGFTDENREINAAESRIRVGVSSLERESASLMGVDWEDNLEQRAYELKKMRELGVPWSAVGQAGNAAGDESQPAQPDDDNPAAENPNSPNHGDATADDYIGNEHIDHTGGGAPRKPGNEE